ncbi:hypothetical protein O6H91_04G143400 [Diphasiastrum complanatum]|uniref:Uncharacterized protein n=1 Tax=Diphasiastrum complanatum TaxID=34168 RepID=A0ACC2E2R3_DIPCM|nr:hypothetical protein O6H91_04G143400 [Diphasiastrum complanatum]
MMEFTTTTQTQINKMEPLWLPPGFRFHPLDDELVEAYLTPKVKDSNFTVRHIGEVDLNRCEPWDLPGMAKIGEKEWYFYAVRDRKYPTGMRTNRATDAGYWKATGKDKEVMSSRSSHLLGMKKTLVFYKGRAPRGEKTNWIMHEYRTQSGLYVGSSRKPPEEKRLISKTSNRAPFTMDHQRL